MHVTIIKENGITHVAIEGRIDTTTSLDFEKSIGSLFADTAQQVIMDCAQMEYVSSSGLRVFLTLQKQSNVSAGSLKLCNMKQEIKAVFDMTGFSSILTIE